MHVLTNKTGKISQHRPDISLFLTFFGFQAKMKPIWKQLMKLPSIHFAKFLPKSQYSYMAYMWAKSAVLKSIQWRNSEVYREFLIWKLKK